MCVNYARQRARLLVVVVFYFAKEKRFKGRFFNETDAMPSITFQITVTGQSTAWQPISGLKICTLMVTWRDGASSVASVAGNYTFPIFLTNILGLNLLDERIIKEMINQKSSSRNKNDDDPSSEGPIWRRTWVWGNKAKSTLDVDVGRAGIRADTAAWMIDWWYEDRERERADAVGDVDDIVVRCGRVERINQ